MVAPHGPERRVWDVVSRRTDPDDRGRLLLDWADRLYDEDYWRAVADAWQDCDRQGLGVAQWGRLWLTDRPGRDSVMTPSERRRLRALPDRATVYRGVNVRNRWLGLSWTLNRDLAHWFARHPVSEDWPGVVIAGTVSRHRVIALFQSRNESEIIVEPRCVRDHSFSLTDPVAANRAEKKMRADPIQRFAGHTGA